MPSASCAGTPGHLCQTWPAVGHGAAQPLLSAPALPRATPFSMPPRHSALHPEPVPISPSCLVLVLQWFRSLGALEPLAGMLRSLSAPRSRYPGCLAGMLWSQLLSRHRRGLGWQAGPRVGPVAGPGDARGCHRGSGRSRSARRPGGFWLQRKRFVFPQPSGSGSRRCGRGAGPPDPPDPRPPRRGPLGPVFPRSFPSSPAAGVGSPRVFRSHRGRPGRARAAAAAAAAGPGAGAARPWRGAAGGGGGGRRGSRICRR